jgi:RNA polymerase sigma-70 factor (ECF subfamily)
MAQKQKVTVIKSTAIKSDVTPISERDDVELVKKFTEGCQRSFEELVKRYETKVHNLAMRLTRNAEDAEEVLQDVFITVHRKIAGFEGKSKFSSWLYRVTVNAAFMKLRKRKQDQSVSLDDMISHVQNISTAAVHHTTTVDCDSLTLSNQCRDALEAAIAKLPEDYSAVFILRDVDGLSNKEVGDILQLSIPAVKSRLHRSRIMLRKRLRKFYEDYSASEKSIQERLLRKAA